MCDVIDAAARRDSVRFDSVPGPPLSRFVGSFAEVRGAGESRVALVE